MEEVDPPEHEGDEADCHHGEVQHVEPAPAEAAGVEQEPVRDYFEQTLDCKYCCKEVVEVVEYLKNEAVSEGWQDEVTAVTLFLSEFELRGSSAASMTLDTRMHSSTRFPK